MAGESPRGHVRRPLLEGGEPFPTSTWQAGVTEPSRAPTSAAGRGRGGLPRGLSQTSEAAPGPGMVALGRKLGWPHSGGAKARELKPEPRGVRAAMLWCE